MTVLINLIIVFFVISQNRKNKRLGGIARHLFTFDKIQNARGWF